MRYWVRARSVWRIESLRFRFALFMVAVAVGSPELAARSSIASIYRHPPVSYQSNSTQCSAAQFNIKRQVTYLPPNSLHHPIHQTRRPW